MRGLFTFEQELRAIRLDNGHKNGNGSKHTPDPTDTQQPWQADIDRVQQTMREVLRAIASIAGVELPGLASDPQNDAATTPQLDIKTLKDRIRNELEAFSIATTDELARQAEEQTRTAMETIQKEVSGRIDKVANEFREKLQGRLEPQQIEIEVSKQSKERVAELVQAQTEEFARWAWLVCKGTDTPIPEQIEKLMEPYVEEAAARLKGSFRQEIQALFAEQEQSVQQRFQGTIRAFQDRIGTLEQTAQQICDQKADSVAKLSEDRLSAVVDDATKKFENKLNDEIEGSLVRAASSIQSSLNESLERYRKQLAETTDAGLEEQRKAITFEITDIHSRLKRAGELLAGLDAENLRRQPVYS